MTGSAPISGNVADGKATAGLFQFEWITKNPGEERQRAGHNNISRSVEAMAQALHFMQSWLDTGKAEIIDPYEEE